MIAAAISLSINLDQNILLGMALRFATRSIKSASLIDIPAMAYLFASVVKHTCTRAESDGHETQPSKAPVLSLDHILFE